MINLDTHVLVHALAGSLTSRERRILAADERLISAVVPRELAKLVQLGRLELDLEHPGTQRALAPIEVVPIALSIARRSTELDFKSVPADELIAATNIVREIPLLTRDKIILESKLVQRA